MLGERHEEVVREQMILQDACLGEYPDVAREFEAEVRTRADRQPLASLRDPVRGLTLMWSSSPP